MGFGRPSHVYSLEHVDSEWVVAGEVAFNALFIQSQCDPEAPVGVAVKAGRDVGDLLAGRRTFDTPSFTVVLSGLLQLDGRWLRPGDLQIVPAGRTAGDTVVGPDGATFFMMFAKRRGMVAQFEDPEDRDLFARQCEAEVLAVASGKVERAVALLPQRTKHTARRGVALTTLADVEAYKQAQRSAQ